MPRTRSLDGVTSAVAYSNPRPPTFDPGQISQLLRWIEDEGTVDGIWTEMQTDASTADSIERDRELWLSAAAHLDRARLLGQCDDDGAAAWALADHLRAFDGAHKTWGGAFGPNDRRLLLMICQQDAGSRYVAQEWRAAHSDA